MRESSRWLITKGRIDEAMEILEGIAKTNGKETDKGMMDRFKVFSTLI